MWVEVSPRPRDFCGRPPCPRCFNWRDDRYSPIVPGMWKFALDMLNKESADLDRKERKDLEEAANHIHKLKKAGMPTDDEPPEPVDIGMSPTLRLNAFMKQMRPAKPVAPRQLNCDQIADRQAERDKEAEKELAEKRERNKTMKEVARELAESQAEVLREVERRKERERNDDQFERELLRGVDPRFIADCRNRGMRNPYEIRDLWVREVDGMRRYRY